MIERHAPHPPEQEVTLLIADVSALTGVPAPQLRSWEQAGLLHPRRSPNGVRFYGIEDVARVRLIQRSLDNPGRRGSLRRLRAQLAGGTLRPTQEDYVGLTGPAVMSDASYWQAIVDDMAELVVVCDHAGRLTTMNPALRRVLVPATAEAGDSHQPARIPGGTALPAALEALPLRWVALTGTVHRDVPLLLRGSDGMGQRTLWTVTPLHDLDGAVAGAVGVGRIVSDEPARGAEDWFAMAVHDLRSPVTNIRGRLELAQRALTDQEDAAPPPWRAQETLDAVAQHLAAAERSTEDLIRTMETLLDASAAAAGTLLQQLEPDGVPLDEVIRQAVHHTQQRTSRHQITLALPAAPVLVVGDRARLRQVFDNVLDNAVKYAPDGGPITVQLEIRDTLPAGSTDLPSWLHAADPPCTAPRWALVRIADEGLGIPAAATPHVFDRYWRAGGLTAHIRGTGLGLYACRTIVAAHGGHIWVERSAPAVTGGTADEWHGTVIALLLPLAAPRVLGGTERHGAAAVAGASVD